MNLPPLSKRIVLHGVVFSFLILFIIVDFPFSKPVDKIVEAEKVLDITKDIFVNPFLENKELWKVNHDVIFTGEREWAQNETLEDFEAMENLLENSFMVGKDANPVVMTEMKAPEFLVRPETVVFDIKSSAEKQLIKAASSRNFTHIVKEGETLLELSRIYGIDIQTLIGANQDQNNLGKLKVGQEVRILSTKGVIHKITSYETLSDVARLYKVSAQKIAEFNGIKANRIKVGDTVVVPNASPTSLECRGGYSNGFIWPVKGPISSSFGIRWGKNHNGIDIVVSTGTPIKAAKSGKIIFSGEASGYGNAVYIKHDDNTITRYGHNSKNIVKKDDFVYQGQTIALSGNTGTSTGPHLHFEIRIKNKPVNPKGYLK